MRVRTDLLVGMRWVLITAVAAASIAWLWVSWPKAFQYQQGYAVTYSKGLGQEVTLEVVNETGHPVHFCASIFGWYPNGSVAKLDDICARGVGKIKADAVRRYAEQWRDLEGEVGVFVILTYINGTDSKGNCTLHNAVKSFTIQPKRVLAGENVKVTIKVKAKPPKGRDKSQVSAANIQWPPGAISSDCITMPSEPTPVTVCYYWVLDTTYVSATNTPIPVVVARVSSATDAANINTVRVKLFMKASQEKSVSFSGGALLTTKYSDGSEVVTGFSADIVTLSVTSGLTLNTDYDYSPFTLGTGIIAIGFYGGYAVVRYRKMACTSTCWYLNDYAYMYLTRPRIPVAVYKSQQPLNGDLGNIFATVSSYWASGTIYGGRSITVDASSIVYYSGGLDLLSMSIPLLRRVNIPLSAVFNLATSIGSQDISAAYGEVYAALQTADPRVSIYAIYYKPNALYEFNNRYYPLPSLFVDIKTYRTSGVGQEPES